MKTIYCFKLGVLLEVTEAAHVLFKEFIWKNFKQGNPVYLDGELFGCFDNYTNGIVVINLS